MPKGSRHLHTYESWVHNKITNFRFGENFLPEWLRINSTFFFYYSLLSHGGLAFLVSWVRGPSLSRLSFFFFSFFHLHCTNWLIFHEPNKGSDFSIHRFPSRTTEQRATRRVHKNYEHSILELVWWWWWWKTLLINYEESWKIEQFEIRFRPGDITGYGVSFIHRKLIIFGAW